MFARRYLMATAGCLCLALNPLPGYAGNWQIEPYVEIRETLTDNGGLSIDGDADLVTRAASGVELRGEAGRLRGSLNGEVSFDKYIDRTAADGTRFELLGVGTVNLARNRILLDARTSVSERNLLRGLLQPFSNRSVDTNNRSRISNYSVSAQFLEQFGTRTQVQATLRTSGSFFGDTSAGTTVNQPQDRTSYFASAFLSSVKDKPGIGWSIGGSYLEDDRDFKRSIIDARLDIPLGRRIRPFIHVGEEDFEQPSASLDNRSGTFWGAGADMELGARLAINFEVGERYGDTSGSGRLNYKLSNTTSFNLQYDEDLLTQQQSLEQALQVLVFADGGQLLDDIGTLPDFLSTLVDITNQTYKQNRIRAGIYGQLGITNINATAYHIQREFDETLTDETVIGASFSLSRPFGENLIVQGSIDYNEVVDGQIIQDEDTRYGLTIGARYALSETLEVSGRYYYQHADRFIGEASENAITVGLRKTFAAE